MSDFFQQVKETAASTRERGKDKEEKDLLKKITKQIWKCAKKGHVIMQIDVDLRYEDTGLSIVRYLRDQGFSVRYGWGGPCRDRAPATKSLFLTVEWGHERS